MKREKLLINFNIIIILFFIISIIFPILSLVLKSDFSNFTILIQTKQFKDALFNSFVVTSVSTIISVSLAYLLAFAIHRSNIKRKALLSILFAIPMLIPSISHGMGLINLFGANGLVNQIFNTNISVMGFPGIVLGSILYSFPVAFLMLSDAYLYIDNSMYESAEVLGLSKWQTFKKVTLYYLKKPILSAAFAVFTMIFTDYGVPLSTGARYDTLPVFLYREVIGLLDFNKGIMIGIFLLIPAFISFIFDLLSKEKGNSFTNYNFNIKENKLRDWFCRILTYLVVFFEFIVIGSFVLLAFIKRYPYDFSISFDHLIYVFTSSTFNNLNNSLIMATLSGIIGTAIAYLTAYLTARYKTKLSGVLHVLSIVSLAIPGIVLGITYSLSFNSIFIYDTIFVLVLVNIIHFFASPYLMAYNALGKLNENYEIVGTTCGISRIRIIKDVIIANTKETIMEMFSYIFVNSMITISAVVFLFKTTTMPISLLINKYEGDMMLEEVAIISLTILFINGIVKLIIYLTRRRNYKRGVVCS